MNYLVRVDSLKEKVNYLENQLKNIDEKIVELEQVKANLKWDGDAATTFVEVYDNYLSDLKEIERKIFSYIKFLNAYCDKYGDEYGRLRREFSSLVTEEINYAKG